MVLSLDQLGTAPMIMAHVGVRQLLGRHVCVVLPRLASRFSALFTVAFASSPIDLVAFLTPSTLHHAAPAARDGIRDETCPEPHAEIEG